METRQLWNELPTLRKFFIISLLVAFVSPFLPWFSDISMVGGSQIHLGLTGPTAAIGVASFVIVFLIGLQEIYFQLQNRLLFGSLLATISYRGAAVLLLYNSLLAFAIFMNESIGTSLLSKGIAWGFYISLAAYFCLFSGISIELPITDKKSAYANGYERRSHRHISDAKPIQSHTITLQDDTADLRSLRVGDVSPPDADVGEVQQYWQKQKELEAKISANDQSQHF